jgi:hypothetical protein
MGREGIIIIEKPMKILRIYATIIIIAFSNYYMKGDKFSTTWQFNHIRKCQYCHKNIMH